MSFVFLLRLLKVLFIITIFPLSLLAQDPLGQTIGFPIHLTIRKSDPDIFFKIHSENSELVQAFQTFPIQPAKITQVSETQMRIHLETAIVISLSDRTGTRNFGERFIRSFLVNHPHPENIEMIMSLKQGGIAAFGDFNETLLTDVIDKVNSGETHNLVQELETKEPHTARLQSLEAIEFYVNIEDVGSKKGSNVEHIHLKVKDFANIHLVGPDSRPLKSNSLSKISSLFHRSNKQIENYQKAVAQVISHRARLRYKNWLQQSPKDLPENHRELINKSENIHSIYSTLRCRSLF